MLGAFFYDGSSNIYFSTKKSKDFSEVISESYQKIFFNKQKILHKLYFGVCFTFHHPVIVRSNDIYDFFKIADLKIQ